MKEKSSQTATRLLNLYRAAHAIDGTWRTVNVVFIAETDAFVLEEMKKLPCGEKLARHIENLQSGKTPMGSIARELMPYGGMMEVSVTDNDDIPIGMSESDLESLARALNDFKPDQQHLDAIKNLPAVQQFGDRWLAGIRVSVSDRPDLLEKWRAVSQADAAFSLWERGSNILSWTPTERTRAEVQADLPEYETYLPMFGESGREMLGKLRNFISSV